jgi:hypothetical protein
LGRNQANAVDGSDDSSNYDRELDTNGDRQVSASDALRVINRIGRLTAIESEDSGNAIHPVFSARAVEFLVTDEEIPAFVARPRLPLDDGTPAEFVNVTPPTEAAFAAARAVLSSTDGVSIFETLQSVYTLDLYVIEATSARLGFGLIANNGETQELSLTIWRGDGTLLDAYPTDSTTGIPGGAIDVAPGELIYFRVGSNDENSLSYIFDLIPLI